LVSKLAKACARACCSRLIAASKSVQEIRDFVGLDSLGYLHIDNLRKATHIPKDDLCFACFDGCYPVSVADGEASKYCFE